MRYYCRFLDDRRLPEVLSKKEEEQLIKNINDPHAKERLINGNLRLVAFIVNSKFINAKIEHDDLFSLGTIGLIKAVNTYDPKKEINFASYAAKCIKNEILMEFRRQKKHVVNCSYSLSESFFSDKDGNEIKLEDTLADERMIEEQYIERDEVSNTMTYALNNSIENTLLFLLIMCGKEQERVADELGISQSYVSRKFRKIQNEIKRKGSKKLDIDDCKYLFVCKQEYFQLKIKRSVYSRLRKEEIQNFSSILVSNERELSSFSSIQIKEDKNFFVIELPILKESMYYLAKLIKWLNEKC